MECATRDCSCNLVDQGIVPSAPAFIPKQGIEADAYWPARGGKFASGVHPVPDAWTAMFHCNGGFRRGEAEGDYNVWHGGHFEKITDRDALRA